MEILGLVAGVIGVAAYVPYVRDIVRRTTKPDRASWLIWALQYTVLFFAQVAEGATHSLWLPGLQLVGVIVVWVLSFRFGAGAIDRQRAILLGSVCMALVVWYITNNTAIALFISLAIEASGVVLTAKKAYADPGSETLTMWALIGTAGVIGIAAVGASASFILYLYPVALACMNFSIVGAVLLGRKAATMKVLEAEKA